MTTTEGFSSFVQNGELVMAKARSPEYPAIGLREAIDKVRMVYDKDHLSKVSKAVMASHMGYKSLNGNSLTILSALGKYGLIAGRGEESFVSDLALAILAHEPGAKERMQAIETAALVPELFGELTQRFHGKGSEAAVRSYLLSRRFLPSAADSAYRAYRETQDLVTAENEAYNRANPEAALQVEMSEQEGDFYEPAPPRDRRPSPAAEPVAVCVRKEVITLDEGDVVITFPDGLSAESVADLGDHLQLFIRKAQRRAGSEKKDEAAY